MSNWSYEIELISYQKGVDADGFPVDNEEVSVSILANKLPVHSNEFYRSSQAGFTIEKTFEVHSIEYDGQSFLRFEEKLYQIRRTYEKGNFIELFCERKGDSHEH